MKDSILQDNAADTRHLDRIQKAWKMKAAIEKWNYIK